MDLYRETILDHYHHPRNYGELDHPDYYAEEYNALCGDRIEIYIKIIKPAQAELQIPPPRGDSLPTQGYLGRGRQRAMRASEGGNPFRVSPSEFEIKFQGEGCAISQASASLLTQHVKKLNSLEKIVKLDEDAVLQLLAVDLTPARRKCALIAYHALKKAISAKP